MGLPDDVPAPVRGALPARIGRYRIVQRLARGAMGVVYAAHDDSMDRPVAIKVLIEDYESDPDTRARFYREAQAAASLVHPNIITIFDAAEDRGRSYIVMQLLDGWPLKEYVKRSDAAPIERKVDLMIQVCEGLAAAHARGIVHRDLKPSNLFVQSDGLLKILDFGIARLADSTITRAGTVLGTPDYMSPEQARGEQVDNRSDIFSVGAVFYYMVTGRKPFPGPDLSAVLQQLKFEAPAPIDEHEAPPELARLILQAMAKEPDARPAQIQDVLADLVPFRRQYQHETRRQAAAAGVRWNALLAADTERSELARALGLAPGDEEVSGIPALLERFPVLAQKGSPTLEDTTLDRMQVTELLSGIDAEEQRLRTLLTRWRGWIETLQAGERALAAGDPQAALQLFEEVAAECPASARVRTLGDETRAAVREQQRRSRRVTDLLAEARTAREARDWRRVQSVCDEALALDPGHAAVQTLLADAQQALAREERRRRLLLEGHLDGASQALDEGRFDDAESCLQAAAAIDPHAAAVEAMRLELEEARAAAAEAERVARAAADAICRARSLFRRGHYDRARQHLHEFVASEADAGAAAGELQRLADLQARIERSLEVRRERTRRMMAAATTCAERGALDEAVEEARGAVHLDPSDEQAVVLLDQLIERALNQRITEARAVAREQRVSQAEHIVSVAREVYVRGYVGVALATAANAARLDPGRPELDALIGELRNAAAAQDEDVYDLSGEPFAEPASAAADSAGSTADAGMDGSDTEGGASRSVFAQIQQWALAAFRRGPLTR